MGLIADYEAGQAARHQRQIDQQADLDAAIELAQGDGERYVRTALRGQRASDLALLLEAWAEDAGAKQRPADVIEKLLGVIAAQAMRDTRAVVHGPCTSFMEDVAVWNGEQGVAALKGGLQ